MPTGETALIAQQDSSQIRKFCSSRRLFGLHMTALVLFAVGSGLLLFGVQKLRLWQARPCLKAVSYSRQIDNATELSVEGHNSCCGRGLYLARGLISGGVVFIIFCVIVIILSAVFTLQNRRILKNSMQAPPPFEEEEAEDDTWSAT